MDNNNNNNNNEQLFDHLFLDPSDTIKIPHLSHTSYFANGELISWNGPVSEVKSPIHFKGESKGIVLGSYPMLNEKESLEALDFAVKSFNNGRGFWATSSVRYRIECMEKFVKGLKSIKQQIVDLLMFEICKTAADSQKEVDRTIKYIEDTITALKGLENANSTFTVDSQIFAQIRRAPLGVVLVLGPFNYPFNETYTTLIPALIMGNSVVMKLPRTGVLCHFPTFQLFKECFPPGVINIISGSGRETMPCIMKSGKIDIFAFIGTSKAADSLQKNHPSPHRLRVCLGLEAKNPAIIFPDCNMDVAIKECILGSLSFNGQRCTALKILFVHKDIKQEFTEKFAAAVDNLKIGIPFEKDVFLTPLPEEGKPGYIRELIADAVSKGARIANTTRGGKSDRTFVAPTVLADVTANMRIYHEEQFGPLVPIVEFTSFEDIYDYMDVSEYGQQCSIFSKNPETIAKLVDVLVNQVSRVNINSQCQRGPDILPFTGRKNSAYGTLSISDALRVFSIRALVAGKQDNDNETIVNSIIHSNSSNFLRMDYIF